MIFPDFSLTFPVCSKFPDFSLTGKCLPIFPGFPVRVGTLTLGLNDIIGQLASRFSLNKYHLTLCLTRRQIHCYERLYFIPHVYVHVSLLLPFFDFIYHPLNTHINITLNPFVQDLRETNGVSLVVELVRAQGTPPIPFLPFSYGFYDKFTGFSRQANLLGLPDMTDIK